MSMSTLRVTLILASTALVACGTTASGPAPVVADPVVIPASGPVLPPNSQISGLREPAWIERAGQRRPAESGAALESGDTLRTGARGWAQLSLPDGSVAKLGERSALYLQQLRGDSDDQGTVLRGMLNLQSGALRYTGGELQPGLRRELSLQAGAALTLNLSRADLWIKADNEEDLLCLLAGAVEIVEGSEALVLDQPATYYVIPRDQAPLSPAAVPPGKLDEWLAMTELAVAAPPPVDPAPPAAPAVATKSGWALSLASYPSAAKAARDRQSLQDKGVAAEVFAAEVNGKTWHRVVVRGFASKAEALAYRDKTAAPLGFAKAWAINPKQASTLVP